MLAAGFANGVVSSLYHSWSLAVVAFTRHSARFELAIFLPPLELLLATATA